MRYNFKKIAKVAFLTVAGLLLVGYTAIQQWPANQILSYGVLPLIQYFDINGEVVLKAHNAVGTCTDTTNGVGCIDDTVAVIAAWKAACGTLISGSYACTKRIHATGGTYFFPNGLQTNAGNIIGGGASSVLNPYWYGDGRGSSASGGPTVFLIGNGAPSIGWDNFGTANFRMDGIRVQSLTSATTNPKFLVGWGKTNNCNCDVAHITDSEFWNYATSNKSVLQTLGTENFWVDYSAVYAPNGGHGVTLSSSNTLGAVPTGVTINAGQALQPVSMTQSGVIHSVISVNGGSTLASPLTMAVYLDNGTTATVGADNFYDNDIQLNGVNDVGFADGKIDTATSILANLFGRNNMIECFSAACGANSTEQAIKFGSVTKNVEFTGTNFTKVAETDQRVLDAVTNGTTTVTSATFTCAGIASQGWAAVITDPNGNGTLPGSHVKNCVGNGPATITLDIATTGAGAGGLQLDVFPPDVQLYAGHTNDTFTGRGPSGNFECPIGFGSYFAWAPSAGAPFASAYCPGAIEATNSSSALRISETSNTAASQGLVIRRYQDFSPVGLAIAISNAAGTVNPFTVDVLGNLVGNALTAGSTLQVKSDMWLQDPAPTLTAGCNGAGSTVPTGGAIFDFTTQTVATTSCTVTKSAGSGNCPTVFSCIWMDGGNATIVPFSHGAETTTTAIVNYASGANVKIRGFCTCR